MLDPLKIIVIGGGSYQWTEKIFIDYVLEEQLDGSTFVLHDIDPEALDIMGRVCEKIVDETDSRWEVKTTLDLEEALDGADVVIIQISTGGFETMRSDIEIPSKFGIYQSVGDTVGPGGLSRALRGIPVILNIAYKMEDICPDAWLINLTNPMTTITRAVNKYTDIKTIGLCHEVNKIRELIKDIFDLESENEMSFTVGGVNHFTWITNLNIKGENGLDLLLEYYRKGKLQYITDYKTENPFYNRFLLNLHLLEIFGALPAAGDRHVAEFFPYFLQPEQQKKYGLELTTLDYRIKKKDKNKKRYLKIIDGKEELKLFKSLEEISDLVIGLFGGKPRLRTMNLPNSGQINNLPNDAVVETMAVASYNTVSPLTIGQLPSNVLNLISRHLLNQEKIVDAAYYGDKNMALQVLLSDPLVINGPDEVKKMLEEMLKANKKWMPQ
jgi:alpha-galactosidase